MTSSSSMNGNDSELTTMEKHRPEADYEDQEDNFSEINETSDVSVNSITSNNNNNKFSESMDATSDNAAMPKINISVPEQNLQGENSENNDSFESESMDHQQNNVDIVDNKAAYDKLEKHYDKQDYDKLAKHYEKEQTKLCTLMLLKEREWAAILKLKKLKELKLCKLKREQEMEESLKQEISTTRTKLLKDVYDKIIEVDPNDKYLVESRKYILDLEKEIDVLLNEVMTDHIKQPIKLKSTDANKTEFLASNALKSLVTRSRTVPDASKTGLPRLDVSPLIAEARSKEISSSGKKVNPLQPSLNSNYAQLHQPVNVSFSDMLVKMSSLNDKEKDQSIASSALPSPANNKTTSLSRPNKSVNNANSTAGVVGKQPAVGTTLAKLLSSNNLNSAPRSEESPQYNNKTAINSAGSEKNLSLANLLASAKSRDEQQSKKKGDSTPQSAPICQGCNTNVAQFVCAGCSHQWYCSRECQVAAWDEHSEVCTG